MSSAAAIAFTRRKETKRETKLRLISGGAPFGTTDIIRSGATTVFTYDYESRVTSITKPGMTTNAFSYNGLDTRVGVSDSLGSRNFKRNGIGVTAPVLSDGLAHYTPSGEVRGGVKTTFHSALKNSDVQTSSSGSVTSSRVYDAFGNDLSVSGSWKSPFGYAGQFGYQQDIDTGLKLLGHRYYDSDTGRFLTRGPIKDGPNWYGYCGNQSVDRVDLEGLRAITIGVGGGAIGILGAASASVSLVIDIDNWHIGAKAEAGAGFGLGVSLGPAVTVGYDEVTTVNGNKTGTSQAVGGAIGPLGLEFPFQTNDGVAINLDPRATLGAGHDHGLGGGFYVEWRIWGMVDITEVVSRFVEERYDPFSRKLDNEIRNGMREIYFPAGGL